MPRPRQRRLRGDLRRPDCGRDRAGPLSARWRRLQHRRRGASACPVTATVSRRSWQRSERKVPSPTAEQAVPVRRTPHQARPGRRPTTGNTTKARITRTIAGLSPGHGAHLEGRAVGPSLDSPDGGSRHSPRGDRMAEPASRQFAGLLRGISAIEGRESWRSRSSGMSPPLGLPSKRRPVGRIRRRALWAS